MQPSTPSNTCPTCKSPIAVDAPGGLCPACTLENAARASLTNISGRRSAPPSLAEITPHFPDLEIIELLGAGGMGAVYKTRQPQLDRMVALKILSHDLASDPAFVERFNREARVLGRLSHPNIVAVFEFGTAGPYCYLLMEYVDGVNLRQAMKTGGFTPSEALALVQEICSALKFAHDEGILHRDIKPENILIDSKGRVKIADFGIAKLIGESERHDVTLTLQGSILGSPHYIAPEQLEKPGDVDQRADIYSLGVVLYEMLTGELPIGRFAVPSAKVAMDARIDEIVIRTLEKEREARFQTAEEVRTSVGAVVQNPGGAKSHSQNFSPAQGTSRFSLASAILTGLSLVAIIGGAYIGSEYRDLGIIRGMGKILCLLIMILGAMSAITGFLFGCFALGAIRKSGGALAGLGLSVFSVVLWPLLLLAAFSSFLMNSSQDPSAGSLALRIAVPVLGVALAIASFVLVRGLRRWARGVTDEQGGKRFPGLATPVLVPIGTMVLAVVSLDVLGQVFSGSAGGSIRDLEIPAMSVFDSEPQVAVSVSEPAMWRGGQPDLKMNLLVESGFKATMDMLLEDENGIRRIYSLGEITPNLDGSPSHASLEMGTLLNGGVESEAAKQAMTVVFASGRVRRQIQSQMDLRELRFDESLKAVLVLDAAGTQRIPLANRFSQGQGRITGIVYLEVNVALE